MDLFDYMRNKNMESESPLASRLRPTSLDEVVGQEHIIGRDKLLYRAIKADKDYINNLAERGVISREAAANRILLIEVMHEAGLYPYRREWWHFEEIISISTTRSKYELLDF